MPGFRYFKGNRLGGFRLSDVNKNIRNVGDYFFLDSHIAETSRSVQAALRDRWMVEVAEKEASEHLSVPRDVAKAGVQTKSIGSKGAVNESNNVSIPDVKDVNEKLESRQSRKNKLEAEKEKVAIPDLAKVEESTKERHNDSTQNTSDKVVGPKFTKETSKEISKDYEVKEDKTIKSLSKEDEFDNEGLVTPNLDEKTDKTDIKKEVKKKIEEKVIKKKKRRKKATAENKK